MIWMIADDALAILYTTEALMASQNIDYNFLTELDQDLKCLICLGVAKKPLQHEACGKLFCKECLERHGREKPCPNCRDTNSHYYVDNKSNISIAS